MRMEKNVLNFVSRSFFCEIVNLNVSSRNVCNGYNMNAVERLLLLTAAPCFSSVS